MQLFFSDAIADGQAILDEIESRHCLQVLRKRPGDSITLVDGKGGWYEGYIEEASKKRCTIAITSSMLEYQKPPVHIHIAIAPTKNIARFEWFLEKATEIGISQITPLLCQRSERKNIRHDRLEKVLLAAMKQSLKAYLPQLAPLTPFQRFMDENPAGQNAYIAHCGEAVKKHLKDTLSVGQNVTILIGPEGDFSEAEIELAKAQAFQEITLGQSRLRTETAGLVACHITNLLNE